MIAYERLEGFRSRLNGRNAERDLPSLVVIRLLGNIAHDIRTPATVVRGYLRMVLDGRAGPLSADQRDCLEIALKSAAVLAGLGATVDKAADGIARLPEAMLELQDLWPGACDASRPQAGHRAIAINGSGETP